jgi:hypothetical protein
VADAGSHHLVADQRVELCLSRFDAADQTVDAGRHHGIGQPTIDPSNQVGIPDNGLLKRSPGTRNERSVVASCRRYIHGLSQKEPEKRPF